MKPYQDPNHPGNAIRPTMRCLGCGEMGCVTYWGPWCFECNVARMDRIDRVLDPVRRLLGGLALGLVLWAMPVAAHDFYSGNCCNDRDCAPIHEARVQLMRQGYMIDGNFIVGHLDSRLRETPFDEVEPYHLCKRVVKNPASNKNTRCLYVPQVGG